MAAGLSAAAATEWLRCLRDRVRKHRTRKGGGRELLFCCPACHARGSYACGKRSWTLPSRVPAGQERLKSLKDDTRFCVWLWGSAERSWRRGDSG